MIADGRVELRSAVFLLVIPGIALVLSVFGVYLAGEGIGESGSSKSMLARP